MPNYKPLSFFSFNSKFKEGIPFYTLLSVAVVRRLVKGDTHDKKWVAILTSSSSIYEGIVRQVTI